MREQEWRVNSDRTGGREVSERTGMEGHQEGVREHECRFNSDRTLV